MQLPYSDELRIGELARIFDNKSECYKLFWFQSIMTLLKEGKTVMTFEEIIDEMITSAWYMVSEYHLNLGPADNLEKTVQVLHMLYPELTPSEKKEKLLEYIQNCKNTELVHQKGILIQNVPYRLQAPFLPLKGADWQCSAGKLAEIINGFEGLIYRFGPYDKLNTLVIMDDSWSLYLLKNSEIISGWIEYNMITYLQRRNPNVPGISDKLAPPQTRMLTDVGNYWKLIRDIQPLREIYGGVPLQRAISIDHFVPWSYVANDEFWNLHPTTKSINSQKGNALPDWDTYIDKLCDIEYLSYSVMQQYEVVREHFNKCAKNHLNSDEVRSRLFCDGLSKEEFSKELKTVMEPVYQSAKNCGFKNWVYTG